MTRSLFFKAKFVHFQLHSLFPKFCLKNVVYAFSLSKYFKNKNIEFISTRWVYCLHWKWLVPLVKFIGNYINPTHSQSAMLKVIKNKFPIQIHWVLNIISYKIKYYRRTYLHTHIDNCSTDFCLNTCFLMIAHSNAAAILIYWNCIIIYHFKNIF